MKYLFFVFFLLLPLSLIAQTETYTVEKAPFSRAGYDEISPVYNGNRIVFSSNRKAGLLGYTSTGGHGLFSIFYADTTGDGNGKKVKLFSKALTSKLNDGPVTFNSTGDTVYFTRNRLVEGKTSELSSPYNKLGIFSAALVNGEWTNIREFRYNSDWYNISTPFLTHDGKRLYFASDKPFGQGGYDLYYSEWKNGAWENPVNLGPVINTDKNEAYPWLNPAGELFFSSDGHEGFGGKDIFFSRFADNSWREPVPLDPPVNSEYDDFGFISDTFLLGGYFSSNRNISFDIYQFKTVFPQIFYTDFQRENQYCYSFSDDGPIHTDTTDMQFLWHFGDGKKAWGETVQHCYEGTGDYPVRLDIVQKRTGELFFTKLQYLLKIRDVEQAYIQSPTLAIMDEEIEFSGVGSYLPGYKIIDYAWDFGDGTRLFGDSVKHTFAGPGEYPVNMVATLRSVTTGIVRKTAVSKNIKIFNNTGEKTAYQTAALIREQQYTDVRKCENAKLLNQYSAEALDFNQSAFMLELISHSESLGVSNVLFRNIPDKYTLKERFNPNDSTYSYTIELHDNLMALNPAYMEMRKLGFTNAQVKVFELTDPAEKELFNLLKSYDTSMDSYFDRNERLTTDAYIMLDQILKFMTKYLEKRLEIGVHSDNTGSAAANLSLSQRRANSLADYLVNRGVERSRIKAKGFGGTKPITDNSNSENRKLNRRVEFRI